MDDLIKGVVRNVERERKAVDSTGPDAKPLSPDDARDVKIMSRRRLKIAEGLHYERRTIAEAERKRMHDTRVKWGEAADVQTANLIMENSYEDQAFQYANAADDAELARVAESRAKDDERSALTCRGAWARCDKIHGRNDHYTSPGSRADWKFALGEMPPIAFLKGKNVGGNAETRNLRNELTRCRAAFRDADESGIEQAMMNLLEAESDARAGGLLYSSRRDRRY